MWAGAGHTDIAAYVLGVLGEAESARFEEHLMGCPDCQLDLVELYRLPDVLDLVKKNWPDPPAPVPGGRAPAPGPRVLRGLMAEAKRKYRRRVALLAAAAALVVAGPVVTLAVRPADAAGPSVGIAAPTSVAAPPVSPHAVSPTTAASPPAESLSAASVPGAAPSSPGGGPSSGRTGGGFVVTARVTVAPREWGSSVDLELGGITGPADCELLAIASDGAIRTVAGWSVPAKGYGVPGSPAPLRVSGTTYLADKDISRFEVRSADGVLLAAITR
ncbi:anti-sigma factor family protein [Amycolatopsis saalfeldensis]|uniref:Putative zinc-finger n=1 Tax=Amycolatopsis saalfeldensis TaxID=394193 RepID=A0A1H8X5P1_9PSEU|nr:zf-HC2 domain-containing protein [Amycolatopsis saalfeldensis]SEP35232.1 Putative zinc-finger [Amycolatopsis saalfeldensis]